MEELEELEEIKEQQHIHGRQADGRPLAAEPAQPWRRTPALATTKLTLPHAMEEKM